MATLLRKNLCLFEKSLLMFGVYLDPITHENYRRRRTILKFIWIPLQLLHTFRFYVEIYELHPKIETWIVQGAVAYVVSTALFYILLCFYYNNQQKMLVEWCECRKGFINDLENSFAFDDVNKVPEKFQEIFCNFKKYADQRFSEAEEESAKTSKLLAFLVFTFYLSLPYTNPIYGYLNGRPYTLPFLLTLPYVPVTGMKTYIINWLYQVLELVFGCAAFFIFYTICAIVLINLNAQLDVMAYLCKVLKSESIYGDDMITDTNTNQPRLKTIILKQINDNNSRNEAKTDVKFTRIESKVVQNWITLFVKIHNDTTSATVLFQEMSSKIFLMFYTVCYGSLFLIYFVIMVEKETYFYATSVISIPFILFLICAASESLIEKVSNTNLILLKPVLTLTFISV